MLLSSLVLWMLYRRSKSSLIYWYSLGLFLIALGMALALILKTTSSPLSWMGRSALYFSGIFLFIAVLVARAEARARGVELHKVIAEFTEQAKVNYELLVNTASDAIIAVDGLGRILMWNPAAEKMFGYSGSEAIGKAFFDLLINPEQVDSYEKAADTAALEGASPVSLTVELKARRRNGEEFPVSLTLVSKEQARGVAPYYYSGNQGHHRAQESGGRAEGERGKVL